MKKLILAMVIVIVITAISGCIFNPNTEIVPTPTPTPTPTPMEPEVRDVDVIVDYTVKKFGVRLHSGNYTYRLNNTMMTDDEIRTMVDEKVKEISQDRNINPDWIDYVCLINVLS